MNAGGHRTAKTPVLAATLGAALLIVGGSLRPTGEPSTRPARSSRVSPAERLPVSGNGDRVQEPAPIETVTSADPSQVPPPRARTVSPPEECAANVDYLRAWLLGLPDADLASLLESGLLASWVSRIMRDLSDRTPDHVASGAEIDDFLARLNIRIRQVPGSTDQADRE